MSDWLRRYAVALGQEPLTGQEVAAILELARDVAHGTERKLAPLSTFLAGIHAAGHLGEGGVRAAAINDAIEIARRLVSDGEAGREARHGEGHADRAADPARGLPPRKPLRSR
ncbi:MAG: DUF6457 domain-containing protein [Actinomycetota bacterium]|nr:DUF6457 domain-containing protein [Actinomycetota bacterium]